VELSSDVPSLDGANASDVSSECVPIPRSSDESSIGIARVGLTIGQFRHVSNHAITNPCHRQNHGQDALDDGRLSSTSHSQLDGSLYHHRLIAFVPSNPKSESFRSLEIAGTALETWWKTPPGNRVRAAPQHSNAQIWLSISANTD